MPTNDAIPHALLKQIVFGFRTPGADLFYQSQTDQVTPQLMMRGRLPEGAQRPLAIDQGLQDLGR